LLLLKELAMLEMMGRTLAWVVRAGLAVLGLPILLTGAFVAGTSWCLGSAATWVARLGRGGFIGRLLRWAAWPVQAGCAFGLFFGLAGAALGGALMSDKLGARLIEMLRAFGDGLEQGGAHA
jgi:hypothetical protein